MVVHVVNRIGGGYGTLLKMLMREGEIVWELSNGAELPVPGTRIDKLIFHGYIPDFPFRQFGNSKKYYVFHGLRMVSRRMIGDKRELNPLRLLKLIKFRKWLSNFDEFISVSFSMAERARTFYKVDSKVVHLGIPLQEPCKENGDYFLWIGRDAWIKGLDEFFSLMEKLPEYKGVIAGNIQNNSHMPENVRMLGFVENIRSVICKSIAIVITSRFEAFSMATLEALSLHKPVLVLKRARGAWEILQILGLYEWGFDKIDDIVDYLKEYTPEFPKDINLSYFSFENFLKRWRKAIG